MVEIRDITIRDLQPELRRVRYKIGEPTRGLNWYVQASKGKSILSRRRVGRAAKTGWIRFGFLATIEPAGEK